MAKEKKGERLDLSVVAIIGNLVFSEKEVWAYYQVSSNAYDFLSIDGKLALAINTTTAFANLMVDKNTPIDAQIINTSTPIDTEAWAEQVFEEVAKGRETPGLDDFIREQRYFLEDQNYHSRVPYLGICLGKRGALEASSINFFEMGVKGAWEEFNKWAKKAVSIPGGEISAFEEEKFKKIENNYYTIISQGHLNATRVTAEDLLLLIKREFYPAMPPPYLDVDHSSRLGPGDLELELYSGIKNKYRWMEFNQQIYQYEAIGYRATLTFSKFPKETRYPMGIPFLYLPTRMMYPYTTYARFTLLPTSEMKKEVTKKQKELDDELINMAAGDTGSTVNTGAEASEALGDSMTMDAILSSDKTPWVQGTYRIIITASTEEFLKEQISMVKQQYADMGINVTHTSGDQAELFLEMLPGDRLREKSFQQTTNLYQIGASGFNFSSTVGDRILGRELQHE